MGWFGLERRSKMRRVCLLLVVLMLTAADAPLPPVRILMGSSFLVGLDSAGKLDFKGEAAAPLTAGDFSGLQQLLSNPAAAMGPNSVLLHGENAPPMTAHFRFSFVPFDGGKQSVLIIENGFPRSFMYKARVGRGSRSMVTDVCELLPNHRSYEHWPYPLDWIDISDIQPVKDAAAVRCE
jgi:hypothetical protein